jgi:GTP pyrophosphokinase
MKTIDKLIEKVLSYNPKADVEVIKKAYIFSREAHCSQKRLEGSPYIHHPLAVADILADMKLDTATIAAGLLHDTVEDDTGTSTEDINEMFGSEVAFLVDALTKLSRVEFKTKEEAQAENFRKMLLAMSKDVRVILIKFADRLHNMRTIDHLPEEKRRRIASETLDIYAPLANRLGIGWLRTEFEDLSFKALMPDLFNDLHRKVAKRKEDQMKYMDEVRSVISEKLAAAGISAKVKGRIKHYYGIYQKMMQQKIPFEQVHDVIGLRIITDTVSHCYDILGIIHSLWPLVPGRFKDFISLPKSNMYQSLHTTVSAPGGDRVEFQIRTDDMDEIAEEGIASHWRYKEKDGVDKKSSRLIAWLRELIKEISDANEFLEAVKGEVIPETVYVFTPNGDIKELPIGSTPVDFAYSVHTQVGHKCVGAKVNGRIVPLRYKLNSGDVVEIITSPSHGPSKDWLKFVVTQRAKSRIKQWIKTEERKQSSELGTKLIEEDIRRHGLPLSILKSEKMSEVLKYFSHQTIEDLYVSVGYGKISAHQVANRLMPEKAGEVEIPKLIKKPRSKKSIINIKGIDNVLYHVAKCCFPVPGDRIVGFITKGKGVTIHRKECNNLERIAVDDDRLIEVAWSQDNDTTSQARLYVESIDKPGMLANLSSIISSADVNINFLKASSTHDKRALFELTIEIKNRGQLNSLVNKLSQMDGVLNVRR